MDRLKMYVQYKRGSKWRWVEFSANRLVKGGLRYIFTHYNIKFID